MADKRRKNHLTVAESELLEGFGYMLRQAFKGTVPYHVGSSLNGPYRDVDVRVILADADVANLDAIVDRRLLGVALSLWGERATGLPLDVQVQSMMEANVPEHGKRNALGIIGPLRLAGER